MNKLWWVIFALSGVIILLLLFSPTKEPNKEKITALENGIAIADQRIKARDVKIQSLLTKIAQDSIVSVENERKFKYESKSSRNEIARLRANVKVVEVLKSSPETDSLVLEQSELIARQEEHIFELRADMKELQINVTELTANFQGQIKDLQANYQAQKEISDTYRKELRKVRRGNRWLKVGAVAMGVGGLFLGGSL